MRPRDGAQFSIVLETGKVNELSYIIFVGALRFLVPDVLEPFAFRRHVGQLAELGGRKSPVADDDELGHGHLF